MPFVVLSVSGPNGVNGQNGHHAAIPSGSYMNGDDGLNQLGERMPAVRYIHHLLYSIEIVVKL